jgi:hypothetical protein
MESRQALADYHLVARAFGPQAHGLGRDDGGLRAGADQSNFPNAAWHRLQPLVLGI